MSYGRSPFVSASRARRRRGKQRQKNRIEHIFRLLLICRHRAGTIKITFNAIAVGHTHGARRTKRNGIVCIFNYDKSRKPHSTQTKRLKIIGFFLFRCASRFFCLSLRHHRRLSPILFFFPRLFLIRFSFFYSRLIIIFVYVRAMNCYFDGDERTFIVHTCLCASRHRHRPIRERLCCP